MSAFSSELPIILNGGVNDHGEATMIMKQTSCHAVMAATGYLSNHRSFDTSSRQAVSEPHCITLEYLEMAEICPPPSYLYIQKHLRWIFRDRLQPSDNFDSTDYSDWRVKLWTFLVRPYLRSIEQFKLFVALYVKLSDQMEGNLPESIQHLLDVSFSSIKKAGKRISLST